MVGFGNKEKEGESQRQQRTGEIFLFSYPIVGISWPQILKSRKGDPAFSSMSFYLTLLLYVLVIIPPSVVLGLPPSFT